MVELRYAATASAALRGAETVLLLAPQRALRKGWLTKTIDAPWADLLKRAAKDTDAGVAGTSVVAQNPGKGPKKIVLAVLPDERSRHNCPARPEAIASAVGASGVAGGPSAVIACAEEAAHVLPIARAVGRMLPTYSRKSNGKKSVVRLAMTNPTGGKQTISKADKAVVDRSRWAAMLVDTPPEEMTTTAFVSATRKAARGIKHLRVSVISGNAVLEQKMGGLHAVGRTALHPPRLLLLEYRPPKPRMKLGIVGKGVVYDTGGLSLKVGGHMAGMKCDMGGAAAAVGAALALADAGHKDAFVCAAGLVENAIGPKAYRPDDILPMHSGHTVEINNTDAEGRLVLADACSFVARKKKPDVVIDMATLTGAQLIATGHRHAGIVSNRGGLEDGVRAAGIASGDLAFPMPFAPEFFQNEFRSKVADMKNSVADRMNAQSSCAGQFIYSHIDDLDIPWLHIDLAGPAFREERGTGYGVALVATLARSLTKKMLAS
ncbi:MAG: leucyl aminopeptidase family protein [Planctomycetota bacterium]|nr:leucyl aminopeptidase family protein [Planctomycetota bacterium]